MEKALFGAGCFWGVEESFRKLPGVKKTEVGYSGGNTINPTYETVCVGDTNHAEVVLLKYDENEVSFENLLDHFWKSHDPTTLNRQGPDIGTQYRSEIFYINDDQKKIAEKIRDEFNKKLNGKVVTKISQESNYVCAEEYHQKYFEKKGI